MCSYQEGKTLHIFQWTIKNFRACTQKYKEFFDSPVFMAESLDETSWFIKLYPRGNNQNKKEFVSCFLYRSINCTGSDEVECDVSMEAMAENKKSLAVIQFVNKFRKGESYGEKNFIERNSILNMCSDDTITIKVSLRKKLMVSKIFSKNTCFTNIATNHFSFKWNVRISNSSGVNVKPVYFSENLLFNLIVEIPKEDVEIRLQRVEGFVESQKLACRAVLLNLKGEEADSKKAIFEADNPNVGGSWKFPIFLTKTKITAEKDKYLENDYFSLKFDFDYSNGTYVESMKNIECKSLDYVSNTKENPSAILMKNLKSMFTNHVHTDVELRVGKEIIRAHKFILCARSPVFLAMFNQEMIEKQSGAINISDIEAATLNSLLEFMYTGDTEILNHESALKLLLVSDRNQVFSLKEKCSSVLESLLSDENCCQVLFTANLLQQESLKICAMDYIRENSKKILTSDEWKQLVEKNLKLAIETVCEVSALLTM